MKTSFICLVGFICLSTAIDWKGCKWQTGDGKGGPEMYKMLVNGNPLNCINLCKTVKTKAGTPNGATVDAKTGTKCYCEFGMTKSNGNAKWKTCQFPVIDWIGCEWQTGDGKGGSEIRRKLVNGNPLNCINFCKTAKTKAGTPNGATVDAETGTKCYCEFGMTKSNGNAKWKTCQFPGKTAQKTQLPAGTVKWAGCKTTWKIGSGKGRAIKRLEDKNLSPAQCIYQCVRQRGGNGVTMDEETPNNCLCVRGANGLIDSTQTKSKTCVWRNPRGRGDESSEDFDTTIADDAYDEEFGDVDAVPDEELKTEDISTDFEEPGDAELAMEDMTDFDHTSPWLL